MKSSLHARTRLAVWIVPLALLWLAATPTFASVVSVACPQALSNPSGSISGTSNAPYETNVGAGQDACNIIITFNPNGSIVTTLGAANPFDGVEDQLVGIVNNSGHTITSLTLSNPGVAIFGLDGDGICAYQPFVVAAPSGGLCNGSTTPTTTNPGSYLGMASSFSSISGAQDSGHVNFTGIPSGGTGYFSLEHPASLSLQIAETVPEPATVALIGMGLCGIGLVRRRVRKM